MSDDFEQRLAAMRPADLPLTLHARLVAAQPRGKIRWIALAAPLAAAAIWMLVASLHRTGPPRGLQPSDFRVFVPVEETSTLVEAQDIAFIDADPARPVRLVQATWLDEVTYRGDDGRTLRRQEPRVEFIPVVLEAF